jgi:predicted Zn-ribbon and HTH transcriptional regulator
MTPLEYHTISAREISAAVRIPEREVIGHLVHIRATTLKIGRHLPITPTVCKKCGFPFKKRERFFRPGKCPVCHNEHLAEPLYCIR